MLMLHLKIPPRGGTCLTTGSTVANNVTVIDINGEAFHAYRCKARRVGKTGLDRAHDPRLHGVVAGGPCHPGIHHWERTNELLERRQRDSLARSGGPNAFGRDLVAAVTLER